MLARRILLVSICECQSCAYVPYIIVHRTPLYCSEEENESEDKEGGCVNTNRMLLNFVWVLRSRVLGALIIREAWTTMNPTGRLLQTGP